MNTSPLQHRLLDALAAMDIVDSHEHLGPEEMRLEQDVDVFTLFAASGYIGFDLERAGMSQDAYLSLRDPAVPLEKRWAAFEPYWDRVRYTSFGRAIRLGAEKFYGATDITAENYQELSEAIAAANQPGVIRRILCDGCNIRLVLNNTGDPKRTDLYAPLMYMEQSGYDMDCWEGLVHPPFAPEAEIHSLDDLVDTWKGCLRDCQQQGTVGLKTAAQDFAEPCRAKALELFAGLKSGRLDRLAPPVGPFPYHIGRSNPLRDYLHDEIVTYAGELGLVVAVHVGYWGDFRNLSAQNLIPVLIRHPDVRFDVYHLGYPWVRETLMLGKGFSNVWINFCWAHMISQRAAADALDEALDLLPTNKVLGFGGDAGPASVESVYGHLTLARENVASVLAHRIERGHFNEDRAIDIARQWFWDNPIQLYGLTV